MKNNKRAGIFLVVLGIVMLAAALLLLLHNQMESEDAGKAADSALSAIQQAISEKEPTETQPVPTEEEPGGEEETVVPEATEDSYAPEELTVVEINGHEYIGYLYVPDLDLSLPVMKLKYIEDLQESPCLQLGSPLTDDAVIAAHNYPSHFGPLRDLKGGESIRFTDMTGYVIEYTVQGVRTIDPKETPDLSQEPYDMTLYTCTTGGKARVVISCDRAGKTA